MGLAHVLGPVDLELVKLGFIVFIHAVYIFKASKWMSTKIGGQPLEKPEEETINKENSKLETEEDEFYDGLLDTSFGDSQVPGYFQAPERVVTTSVPPKTSPPVKLLLRKRR